jgi:hypothetical protein
MFEAKFPPRVMRRRRSRHHPRCARGEPNCGSKLPAAGAAISVSRAIDFRISSLPADGGLELPLKLVSTRLGHASISITADRYGHLFPSNDDGAELAAAERLILRSV